MMSVRSPSPSRSYLDPSDPLQPLIVEELLKGQIEWRNIQDIIRVSFRALTDTVKSQGQAIRDLEKALQSKTSKSEFHSIVSQKVDYNDFSENLAHLKAQLENKSSHFEVESLVAGKVNQLNYMLSEKASIAQLAEVAGERVMNDEFNSVMHDVSCKLELVHEEINRVLQVLPSQEDLNDVRVEANSKVLDLHDSLRSLQQSHEEIISKKVNRSEYDVAISRKNDEIKALHLAVEVKAEAEWTENSLQDLKKLISQSQASLEILELEVAEFKDKAKQHWEKHTDLIEGVKSEIDNTRHSISQNVSTKADTKELEKALNLLHKKADQDSMHEQFSLQRKMTNESITEKFTDVKGLLRKTEEGFLEKIRAYEEYSKQLESSIKEAKHVLKMLESEHKANTKEAVTSLTRDIENTRDDIKDQLNRAIKVIEDLSNDKVGREEVKDSIAKLSQKLGGKADIADFERALLKSQKELVSSFQTIRDDYKIIFTKLENQMSAKFDQLITRNELRTHLNEKADNSQISRLISSKLNLDEIIKLRAEIETSLSELRSKASKAELESHMTSTKIAIEEIGKELLSKAYIKDVCTLLDTKASIEDVNSALVEIHKELDNKIGLQAHTMHLNEQQALNSVLCSENTVGRWIWRNGELANGFAVPWEIQSINTAPDNFVWEPEVTNILVITPGLYEITFGFYCKKKPTVQLLVNGEIIFSAVNNASYVIHHSSGRLKNAPGATGTVSGLTLIDFIALPPRAKLSLSYNGDRKCEGFLALRKL